MSDVTATFASRLGGATEQTSTLAPQMRDALRCVAKSVAVITSEHYGKRYAMTATAVSELSLDPPSLLICINRSNALYAPLSAGAGFCVNFLHSSQQTVSAACSGVLRGEVRFDTGGWAQSMSGLPFLQEAQASFMCRNDKHVDCGTHTIFIGLVEDILTSGVLDPLVYFDRRYTLLDARSHSR